MYNYKNSPLTFLNLKRNIHFMIHLLGFTFSFQSIIIFSSIKLARIYCISKKLTRWLTIKQKKIIVALKLLLLLEYDLFLFLSLDILIIELDNLLYDSTEIKTFLKSKFMTSSTLLFKNNKNRLDFHDDPNRLKQHRNYSRNNHRLNSLNLGI
ncbi:hypothetical protein BpHYR1_016789 [Brachionus plicatilis]|uniref:Transmembrane protein n=1 Tax=Brachionus plicatilis TaxID=10195 RepID=A0A3M7RJN3_BRAPC|nr:hypothetical protein BpHYR1_016789 [Brachionus plicatilis]